MAKSSSVILWDTFSIYIRRRDADENGIVICISCGVPVVWNAGLCHAGHYYNQGTYKGVKYAEENVNGQCRDCNIFKEGNKQGYREGLIRKYGEGVLLKLESALHNRGLSGKADHVFMTDYYKGLIKKLKAKQRF